MLNNTALDVVIGLVFVYGLYSLFATVIKEGVAALLSLRARMLTTAITRMLKDDHPGSPLSGTLVDGFFGHELVKYMSKGGWFSSLKLWLKRKNAKKNWKWVASLKPNAGPSYISAENFSKVIVDVLKKQGAGAGATPLEQIKAALASLGTAVEITAKDPVNGEVSVKEVVTSDTMKLLQSFLDDANNDLDKFRTRVETWFNDMMDRASGWYKRRTQLVLLGIGFVIAAIFNVNTFDIEQRLATDNVLREKLVQSAVTYVHSHPPPTNAMAAGRARLDSLVRHDTTASHDTSAAHALSALQTSIVALDTSAAGAMKVYKDGLDNANQVLGLGWADWATFRCDLSRHFVHDTGGWLVTAIAISLGAPFWFDLLNKLIQLRGTGPKPAGTPGPGTRDAPAKPSQKPDPVG